jgi:hypothetical protein
MQTFITHTNPAVIAKHLDNKRLNKQALEGWQILMNLLELDPEGNHRTPKGWSNHPAVKMWRGHELFLASYIDAMVIEWKNRGYKSTIGDKTSKTVETAIALGLVDVASSSKPPVWWQDKAKLESVIASHRRALLVKDFQWYHRWRWNEDTEFYPTTYDYVWPVAK